MQLIDSEAVRWGPAAQHNVAPLLYERVWTRRAGVGKSKSLKARPCKVLRQASQKDPSGQRINEWFRKGIWGS